MDDEEYRLEQYTDFMVKLYRSAVVQKENPALNNNTVEIKIYSSRLEEINGSKININGRNYNIKSQELLNKIEKIVTDNLDILIGWSKNQNRHNLDLNAYDGGMARTITIKYGQLIINVNGQVSDIGNMCDKFIDAIVSLILNESNE